MQYMMNGPRRAVSVLMKPASSLCNLNCAYCFYLSKRSLYPWEGCPKMSLETLEEFLRQYMSLFDPPFFFMWQGGEPTLMGLPFFRAAVELEAKVALKTNAGRKCSIGNAIQTNAALLDEEWARFLKEWHFFVGISLDGPREWHDRYRTDRSGRGSHARVMSGVAVLRRYQIDFNALVVVSQANVQHPRELLGWLVKHGFTNLQFSPCVELSSGSPNATERAVTPESIDPDEYALFLNGLFDAWLEVGVDRVRIRWFDNLVQMLWGRPSQMCQFAPECGYIVLEHNGDCYPCDFLVEEDWRLGNIHDTDLSEMMRDEKLVGLSRSKGHFHPDCLGCPWQLLCHGECPRYRIINEGESSHALPYFCEAYKQFYQHNYKRLERVALHIGRKHGVLLPGGHLAPAVRARTGHGYSQGSPPMMNLSQTTQARRV